MAAKQLKLILQERFDDFAFVQTESGDVDQGEDVGCAVRRT
jgi:hypothetical protein